MATIGGSSPLPNGPFGATPEQNAVQALSSLQQQLVAISQQYALTLSQFQQALQQLNAHLSTPRTPQNAAAWDATATRLAGQLDQLGLRLQALADKMADLLKELARARATLTTTIAEKTSTSVTIGTRFPRRL